VKVVFEDDGLERLEVDAAFDKGFEPGIAKAFRRVVNLIRQAPDERDFYSLKSLRFEKLKGSRSDQRSMKLNEQWRLILRIQGENPKEVVIVGIEDYH
jgi:proteic killer suppression protein